MRQNNLKGFKNILKVLDKKEKYHCQGHGQPRLTMIKGFVKTLQPFY